MMRAHPLVAYFVLAYAFSWLMALPAVFAAGSAAPGLGYNLKQWIGPALAAIIVTAVMGGGAGLRRLRDRCLQWRAGWPWYLFILLGVPALLYLAITLPPGAQTSGSGLTPTVVVTYVVTFVIVFFLVGLPEEIGWRGFALPRMQPRYGPLWGSLLLGVLWGGWHLLYFLTPAHGGGPGVSGATALTNFALFLLMVIALSIIFTWVFNHTQGSVFLAGLLHSSIDTPQAVFVSGMVSAATETRLDLTFLVVFGTLALLIVLLTRGRLGYKPSEGMTGAALESLARD
jgi:membrane protease YdiL (CAAX protease family)